MRRARRPLHSTGRPPHHRQQFWYVYVRWQGQPPLNASGQHPANDDYPTLAWRAEEIVPDFYLLPHPISAAPQRLAVQVAVAPPFTPEAELTWQTVTTLALPATGTLDLARPYRIQLGPATLSGAQFPTQIRPQTALPVLLTGSGERLSVIGNQLSVASDQQPATNLQSLISYEVVFDGLGNGRFPLIVQGTPGQVVCGWLQTGRRCLHTGHGRSQRRAVAGERDQLRRQNRPAGHCHSRTRGCKRAGYCLLR